MACSQERGGADLEGQAQRELNVALAFAKEGTGDLTEVARIYIVNGIAEAG